MSKRNPILLLNDIIESGNLIAEYTTEFEKFEDFISDRKTVDAVIRNFEIIGEAANRLPENFKNKHISIDWQRIRGFRNRVVHEYFGIDYEIVWRITKYFLPEMISELKQIFNSETGGVSDLYS
ncbi:MAG: DUF86 domain-containing protein [Firmicutes bacterium]|nr:DUF86 domain-containing protein [Bacillota bacterium]